MQVTPRAFSRPLVGILSLICLLAGSSFGQHYMRTDLTADMAATSSSAPNLDPNLINAEQRGNAE